MTSRVLVARRMFPDCVARLSAVFDVDQNESETALTYVELVDRLRDKDGALLMGLERIDAELLRRAPKLRAVCNCGVGYNNLDLDELTRRGIIATNTPGVSHETVADFAWALLAAASRRVGAGDAFVRSGAWRGFGFDLLLGADLHGSTLGVIGMGRIGQAIARRAAGFEMSVIYNSRSRVPAAIEARSNARWCPRGELLAHADHVVLAVPYGPETHHLIGAAELSLMRPTATLVNIARGGVVDDSALAAALKGGVIAAAALDVFEGEPDICPELLDAPNLIVTPHIASASVRTRKALANLAVDNLLAALGEGPDAGRPPSILNPQVLGPDERVRLRGSCPHGGQQSTTEP
jgi:gluconate 2-dehydrogenase